MHKFLCLIFAVIFSGGYVANATAQQGDPSAAVFPAPFAAEYKVKVGAARGEMTLELSRLDNHYHARALTRPRGLATLLTRGTLIETSHFNVTADGIVPLNYSSVDGISRKNRDSTLDFDWTTGTVSGHYGDQAVELAIEPGTVDRLLVQFALMRDLLDDGEPRPITMVYKQGLRSLEAERVEETRIEVPYGELDTVVVRHVQDGGKRVTTFWCAPDLDYLPVRIEQLRKGKIEFRGELTAVSRP